MLALFFTDQNTRSIVIASCYQHALWVFVLAPNFHKDYQIKDKMGEIQYKNFKVMFFNDTSK